MRLPLPLRILVTGLAAATAADLGRTIYQSVMAFPAVNWSITGRWFLMVLQGQPDVPNIATAPVQSYEMVAGHVAYYTISVIFAAVYILLLRSGRREPTLWNGLIFGIVTTAFPFFAQMPLMGMGVLASDTTTPALIIGRTLVHHASFGLGLALGAMATGGTQRS